MGKHEYQRWAEPPSEMINDVLLREVQLSGRYQHVYLLRSNAHGNYPLRRHRHDFREIDGRKLTARVAFDFELRDSNTAVWTHSYSHDEPVDGKDVKAVVAALDRNAQSGLSEVMGRRPAVNTQRNKSVPVAGSLLEVHGLGQHLVLQRLFPGLFARTSIG